MMRTTLLTFAAAALVAAPAASAHPGARGFERTYPHASRLCAKVANGHTPKRLAASTTQVAGACAELRSSFTAAQNTYTTTVAPLRRQAVDTRAKIHQARAAHDRATVRASRTTLRTLRKQIRQARRAYHVSVNTARKTFWDKVRALRTS
jgi:hypothetical protein